MADAREQGRQPSGLLASPSGERRLELAERLRGTFTERDRLLDLEVERHPAAVDAPLVLDRDEREEPLELAGAPERLLLGERRCPEALESPVDLGPGDAHGSPVSRFGRRREARELPAQRDPCGPTSLGRIRRRQDPEVPRGEHRGTRAADVEPTRPRIVHRLDRDPQARLVRVQEIDPRRLRGCPRRELAPRERVQGERRVGAGA